MASSKFLPPIDEDKSTKIAKLLQPLLTDFSDLAMLLKHAHWNVRGTTFLPLHEQLDTIVDFVRDASDEIAERIVTLGHPADGLVQSVASRTRLGPLPNQFMPTEDVVREISSRMHSVIAFLRTAIEQSGEIDPVTQDLLIGIAGPMEKKLWMLQSQSL